ncbi:hypothetical protein J8V57_17855 [Xenorhabdus sp. PB61.4]|uniref:hypothetical protein n=1 Tax=Xenorhabdus sp. PB61.4 TaxID=2788940 RepID=UPI001E49AEF1|nr:hypothetical protein [Xenorhabdus sp. PB61.4]MCC8368096.1 hypothetical protein [Xenorhabdus sp. PB61.4]
MQKIGDITNTADSHGEFTNGNVAAGIPPTLLEEEWFNTLQREIINVLLKAGMQPNKTNDAQLSEAISKLVSDSKVLLTDSMGQSSALAASQKLVNQVNANSRLEKAQNGADIQDKNEFIRQLGCIEQQPGTATDRVMSQKSVTTALSKKMNVGQFGFGGFGSDNPDTSVTQIFFSGIGESVNPAPYQAYVHYVIAGTHWFRTVLAIGASDTSNPRIFTRNIAGEHYSDRTEIYTTKNPQKTVNQLSTARKIALMGDATGNVLFDGAKDVALKVTIPDSAKGILDMREGDVSTIKASGDFVSIDTGLMVRGITFTPGAQSVNVRPLQILLNGKWLTINKVTS